MASKQKLNKANDVLNKLENDYDKLKGIHNKNNNDISVLTYDYSNEVSKKLDLENTNKALQNSITEKEEILKKKKKIIKH